MCTYDDLRRVYDAFDAAWALLAADAQPATAPRCATPDPARSSPPRRSTFQLSARLASVARLNHNVSRKQPTAVVASRRGPQLHPSQCWLLARMAPLGIDRHSAEIIDLAKAKAARNGGPPQPKQRKVAGART